MAISEKLALIIQANPDQAIRSFNKVADTAERQLGKTDDKLQRAGVSMQRYGAIAFSAGAVAGVALVKTAQSASDLEEAQNKVNVVFEDGAGEVRSYGKEAAKSLGMSERAALDAASQFGTLFTNIGKSETEAAAMSLQMTTLAGDMASFSNTSPDEAVLALGAALRGEQEPIRRYGVLLNDAVLKQRAMDMGLIDSTVGTLPPAIRAQAAYAEILSQTSKQQGDFARTADGAANQQRIMKAEFDNLKTSIGSGVLPLFKNLLTGVNGTIDVFGKLPEPVRQTTGGLAGLAATAATVGGGLSFVAGKAITMKDSFITAAGAGALGTSLTGTGLAAIGVTAALTIGGIAMQQYAKKAAESERVTALFTKALLDKSRAVKDIIEQDIVLTELTDDQIGVLARAGIGTDTYTDALMGNADAQKELRRAMLDAGLVEIQNSWAGTQEEMAGLREEYIATGAATRSYISTSDDLGDKWKALVGGAGEAAKAFMATAVAQGQLEQETVDYITASNTVDGVTNWAAAIEQVGGFTKTTADRTKEARIEVDGLREAMDALISPYLDLESATLNYNQELIDLNTSLTEGKVSLDGMSEAGIAFRNEAVSGTKTAFDLAFAMQESGASSDTAAAQVHNYAASLASTMLQAGYTQEEVNAYLQTLGLTPAQINTVLGVDISSALDNLRTFSNAVEDLRTTYQGGGNVQFRASGGHVNSGQPYVVGENGPELMVPSGSGNIVPNHALGGGGSITVNISGAGSPAATGEAVVSALRAWQRKNGAIPISTR